MEVDWSYKGATGPACWGSLSPAWQVADFGGQQSPVDLPAPNASAKAQGRGNGEGEGRGSAAFELSTRVVEGQIVNTGLTVRVDNTCASELVVDGRRFEQIQFHFHSPAEHTVAGVRHALELHLVHQAVPGQGPGPALAVVAVLFELGSPNPFVGRVFDSIPEEEDAPQPLRDISFESIGLNGHCIRYDGSLTTPPCSEGVHWCVLHETGTVSPSQLAQFKRAVPFDNYRPAQPLKGRSVDTCVCSRVHFSDAADDNDEMVVEATSVTHKVVAAGRKARTSVGRLAARRLSFASNMNMSDTRSPL